MEQLTKIRLILLVTALFVMFSNLFDCISDSLPLSEYFLNVGVLLGASIVLIFIQNRWAIISLFTAIGALMILDMKDPKVLSGAVVFFIFAIKIAESKTFEIAIYFLTALAVIANNILQGNTPSAVVNILIGYALIFLIDNLISKKEQS